MGTSLVCRQWEVNRGVEEEGDFFDEGNQRDTIGLNEGKKEKEKI